MRPNELGGQTLENDYEMNAAAVALAVDGKYDIAFDLILDRGPEGELGNISSTLLESEPVIRVMDPARTEIVIEALGKVARGQRLVPNKLDEMMAQSMIDRLEGRVFYPRANRIQKSLTRLRRVL